MSPLSSGDFVGTGVSLLLILKTIYRPAFADELGRAASLCAAEASRPGDWPLQCFVAVRERPVERLVGAAFWRLLTAADGRGEVEFEWAGAVAHTEDFLRALVAEVKKQYPACERIAASAWLPEGHPLAATLEAAGFAAAGKRQLYGAEANVWREALATAAIAEGEVLTAPAGGHFDELRALLCGPALRPAELAHGFQTAGGESPSLFDARCSAVLTEGGKVTAVCLANGSRGHLTVAALHGTPAQGDLLLQHCLQARDHFAEPVSLSFYLDDRDPSLVLSALIERLPVQNGGGSWRYEAEITHHLV